MNNNCILINNKKGILFVLCTAIKRENINTFTVLMYTIYFEYSYKPIYTNED